MTKRTVNLDTYSLSLLTAKEDILNPRSSTNWALFTYDGVSNKLKLADSGVGGVAELAGKFHISKPQYGLCKLGNVEAGAPRIAMIIWFGQNVEEYRRTECTSHIPDIKSFFKEAQAFVRAEKVDDVTEEKIRAELSKVQSHAPSQWVRRSSRSADKEELVGTNYRKTNAAMEMRRINRDSFWARAEREEEERKEEERRRATEERRRLERERVLKERKDAEERDRKMNEKLQMIEEQRRKQAEEEEQMREKEKLRWEVQQREHEEDMRARLKRSESIEKAAEAAALVSQRSMNPREFFRQLSASSQSPTSPGSSRTGKPFRRYQRSLTDTAFIFSKAEESSASSPRSSPLVSPFSRAPPSPGFRATSPPTSPDFRPVTSPQRPRALVSPPTSPPRPAPLPALPSFAQTRRATSPTEPSAPPASPTLLASFPPSSAKNNLSHTQSGMLADLPSNIQSHFGLDFPPQAPSVPLPENPQSVTDLNTINHVHTELVSDIGYKVQAVLVEEDEEEEDEEQHEEHQPETLVEVCPVATEQPEGEEQEQEEVKEEEDEEQKEVDEDTLGEETEEPVEMTQDEEEVNEDEGGNNRLEDRDDIDEPAEVPEREGSLLTDTELVCQEIKNESMILSTNGTLNGDDTDKQNGIGRSLSPSDTELSTSELTGFYDLHGAAEEEEEEEEEDSTEEKDQEISENGQEVLAERQLCVRALYDYQAEDESEISFEPGDIIKDVETVDKAWWKGWSKDGRQGLFPANYVETI